MQRRNTCASCGKRSSSLRGSTPLWDMSVRRYALTAILLFGRTIRSLLHLKTYSITASRRPTLVALGQHRLAAWQTSSLSIWWLKLAPEFLFLKRSNARRCEPSATIDRRAVHPGLSDSADLRRPAR